LHSTDAVQAPEQKGEHVYLMVQVCLATPEQRARSENPSYGGLCCGRGSILPVTWQGEDRSVVLLAGERRPYWVYARLSDGGSGYTDILSLGPFEPGDLEHEIALSFADLCARSRANTVAAAATSEKQATEDARSSGGLRARIVDAATREPIVAPGFAGEFLGAQDRRRWMPPGQRKPDGVLRAERVPAGDWKVTVSARGHKPLVLERISIPAGDETDLGMLALEPRAPFQGQLELADGSAAPRGTIVSAIVGGSVVGRAEMLDQGLFTIEAELPPSFLLLVHQRLPEGRGPYATQVARVESWDVGKTTRLRLAPWRSVQIRVTGAAAELPESRFDLRVSLAPGELLPGAERPLPDDGFPRAFPAEGASGRGQRVFELALVAARYQVEGGGLLASIPATTFEVRDTDDVQVIEVLSR